MMYLENGIPLIVDLVCNNAANGLDGEIEEITSCAPDHYTCYIKLKPEIKQIAVKLVFNLGE